MESPNSPAILLMSTGHANRQAVNTENTFKRQRYASDGPSTEVVRFLCEIGLHRFAGCMHDQLGIDVLSDLQYLTENMLESIGMLPTQVAKMLAVARWTHRTFKSTGCASVSQSGKENNSEALGRHRRSKEWVFADQWSGSSQNLDGKIACELAQPVQFSEKIQRKGKSIIDSIVVKLMVCDAVGSTMAFNVARLMESYIACMELEGGRKSRSYVFMFKGSRLQPDDSADAWSMEDNDIIHAVGVTHNSIYEWLDASDKSSRI